MHRSKRCILDERIGANQALELAASRIEAMLNGRDPWISGDVLALHNAVSVCAKIVRDQIR